MSFLKEWSHSKKPGDSCVIVCLPSEAFYFSKECENQNCAEALKYWFIKSYYPEEPSLADWVYQN